MSITNVGKAEDILVNAGFIGRGKKLIKDNIKEAATKLNDDDIKKIVRIDKDNKFMLLEKAGRLLKDSWLTRFTGHKMHDFKSTWTASSTSLTQLYAKLRSLVRKAKEQEREKIDKQLTDKEQQEIKKRVAPALQKAQRQFSKLYKKSMQLKTTSEVIDEFVHATPGEQKAKAKSALEGLRDNERLALNLDFDNTEESQIEGEFFSNCFMMIFSSATLPIGVSTAITGGIMLGLGMLGGITAATLIGPGAFLILACIVACTTVYKKRDSIGLIRCKREWACVQNEYKKAIRYLNEFEDKLEDEIGKALRIQSKTEDFEITQDMKKILNDFLGDQQFIWKDYASSRLRGYFNEDGVTVQPDGVTEHTTGFRKTSNEKTHKIGKLKELLANIWCGLEIKE